VCELGTGDTTCRECRDSKKGCYWEGVRRAGLRKQRRGARGADTKKGRATKERLKRKSK
jgi:hypothetical protein